MEIRCQQEVKACRVDRREVGGEFFGDEKRTSNRVLKNVVVSRELPPLLKAQKMIRLSDRLRPRSYIARL